MDQISYAIPLDENQKQAVFSEDKFVVAAYQTTAESFSGLTFSVNTDTDQTSEATLSDDKQVDSTAAISLPNSIFQDLNVQGSNTARISFNLFVDDALFQPRSEEVDQTLTIISSVISAGIENIEVTGLSNPVSFTFELTEVSTAYTTDIVTCVCIHLTDRDVT